MDGFASGIMLLLYSIYGEYVNAQVLNATGQMLFQDSWRVRTYSPQSHTMVSEDFSRESVTRNQVSSKSLNPHVAIEVHVTVLQG